MDIIMYVIWLTLKSYHTVEAIPVLTYFFLKSTLFIGFEIKSVSFSVSLLIAIITNTAIAFMTFFTCISVLLVRKLLSCPG